MTILVVEDDKSIREILHYVAEKAFPGTHVDSVSCGADALELIQTQGAPGLVLLDLGLPDMSGFEVFAALREKGCDAKVVIVTAEDDANQRVRAAQLGADVFVPKPFDSRELRSILRSLVQDQPAERISA